MRKILLNLVNPIHISYLLSASGTDSGCTYINVLRDLKLDPVKLVDITKVVNAFRKIATLNYFGSKLCEYSN